MFSGDSRIILLSGSPLSQTLKWNEDDLSCTLLPPFLETGSLRNVASSSVTVPAWRSLSLAASHMPTGLTQLSRHDGHDVYSPLDAIGATFMPTNDQPSGIPAVGRMTNQEDNSTVPPASQSQASTQYYEHSFAVHDQLQSSQIVGTESQNTTSFLSSTESYLSESSIISDAGIQEQLIDARLHSVQFSDLQEIPNAAYLHSITPQTVTVNLVVGIISISQPRTIKTRKGGRPVELVEMLVGDETRAGFGINIWLPAAKAHESSVPRSGRDGQNIGEEVLRLRPRDVILARRVALSSFKSNVYGQSLRRGMTTLDLIYRNLVDSKDTRGAFKAREIDSNVEGSGQIAKVKRVKDWVVQFVGAGPPASKMRTRSGEDPEEVPLPSLPLDTQ